MSTRGSAANLIQSVKDFNVQWHHAKASWRDAKSEEFERRYLGELPDRVARALAAMEEIDVILRKVRTDCE